jgi:hypothetical protein
MFNSRLDHFPKPSPIGRPTTKLGDHGTLNAHDRWTYYIFPCVRELAWIEIHRNGVWSGTQSHMTSHYTQGSVTTWHELGGDFRWSLGTLFWALTISRSRLLARVWSGPKLTQTPRRPRPNTRVQSPTLGAHAHAHAHPCPPMPMHAHPCPWVLGGHRCDVIVHGWAWVQYYYSWVGMGGHRFRASLHPAPNQSQTSWLQGIH